MLRNSGKPRDTRTENIINMSGESIPPASFMKRDGLDSEGRQKVIKPDEDNLSAAMLMVSPALVAIPAGKSSIGFAATIGGLQVTYNGTAPEAGDDFGSVANQWYGEADKTGFKTGGVSGGRAITSPRGGGELLVYEATADASGGEVTVRQIKSDGTLVGEEITLKVIP